MSYLNGIGLTQLACHFVAKRRNLPHLGLKLIEMRRFLVVPPRNDIIECQVRNSYPGQAGTKQVVLAKFLAV